MSENVDISREAVERIVKNVIRMIGTKHEAETILALLAANESLAKDAKQYVFMGYATPIAVQCVPQAANCNALKTCILSMQFQQNETFCMPIYAALAASASAKESEK